MQVWCFRPNLDSFGRWILGSAAGVLPALVGTLDPKAGGALLPAGPLQKSCHLGVRPNRFQSIQTLGQCRFGE